MILDAEGSVAGRLCSYVAKQLLKGEKVIVVNAEKAIITGNPKTTIQKFIERRERVHPKYGPFFPRRPDLILRRMIKGMIPYKKPTGKNKFKNLRVYIGIPENLNGEIKKFSNKNITNSYMTILEISKKLGWSD